MASGYGINVSDWVLVAALAAGAFFVYKMIVKPTSEVTESASDLVSNAVDIPAGFISRFGEGLDLTFNPQIDFSGLKQDLAGLGYLFGNKNTQIPTTREATAAINQAKSVQYSKAFNPAKVPVPYTAEGYAKASGTHVSNIPTTKTMNTINAGNFNQKLMEAYVPKKYYAFR